METSILNQNKPNYDVHDKLRERSFAYNPIADLTTSAYDGNFENVIPEDEYSLSAEERLNRSDTIDDITKETSTSNSANSSSSWFSDAINTFLNSRDNINLMSERGKLLKDILPTLDDIDYQLDVIDLKKQIRQLESQKSQFDPNSQEVSAINTQLIDLQNQLEQKLPKYNDILKKYSESEGNNLDTKTDYLLNLKEGYLNEADNIKANIEYYNQKLQNRADDYRISQEFKEQEAKNQQNLSWSSIFKKDFWKYAAPNLLGSSFATVEAYAGSLGSAYLAQLGKTQALRAATKFGGPHAMAMGELAGHAAALAGITGTAISNIYSRHRESLAQVEGAARQKMENELQSKYGITLESLIPEARKKLSDTYPAQNVNKLSDNEIMERLITGEISLDNANLDEARRQARAGLDNVYNNNMALSAMDIVETYVALAPVGRMVNNTVKSITKPIAKALRIADSPLKRKVDDIVDAAIDLNRKWAYSSPKKRMVSDAAKTLAKLGFVGLSEGYEEAQQDIFDYDYINGKYDNKSAGLLNSLVNYGESGLRTTKILLGMNGNEDLASDQQFWDDMIGGFALGLFMGGGPIIGSAGVNAYSNFKANKYVREAVADNIKVKDNLLKTSIYTASAAKNGILKPERQQQILDVLEGFKSNLPEGVTEQDIDEEIARAKTIMSTADSENVKYIAKQAGIEPNSKEYEAFIALNAFGLDNIKEANDNLQVTATADDNFYNNTNSIPELNIYDDTQKSAAITLGRLNIQKNALNELISGLEESMEVSKAIPNISSNKFAKNAKGLISGLKRMNKDVDSKIKALSKESDLDPDTTILPSKEEEGKKLFQQYALAKLDVDEANRQYNLLRGIKTKDGKNVWYNKLSDSEKEGIVKSINGIINNYLSSLDGNEERIRQQQEREETQTPEQNAEQQQTPVESSIPNVNLTPLESKPSTIYTPDSHDDIKIGFDDFDESVEEQPSTDKKLEEKKESQDKRSIRGTAVLPEEEPIPAPEEVITSNEPKPEPIKPIDKRSIRGNAINPEEMVMSSNEDKKPKVESAPTARSVRSNAFNPDDMPISEKKDKPVISKNEPVITAKTEKTIEQSKPEQISYDEYIPTAEDMADAADAAAAAMDVLGDYVNDSSNSVTLSKVTMDGMPKDLSKYSRNSATQLSDDEAAIDGQIDKSLQISSINIAGEEDSENLNKAIESEILGDLFANAGNSSEDKVSHTFFYAFNNDKPLESDAKSGKEASVFLSTPGALIGANIYFDVVSWDGKYKPGKPSTYDSAAVRLVIEKNGNKYILSLKDPQEARKLLDRITNDKKLNEEELKIAQQHDSDAIDRLMDYRLSIIRAFEDIQKRGSNQKLKPSNIFLSNGKFNVNRASNGKSIQRPIQEIKTLGLPENSYDITPDTVTIGIGTGVLGQNAVVDKNGSTTFGKGGSGTLYIYPKATSTPSGKNTTNVQIQVSRFNNKAAKAIYALVTKYKASPIDTVINKKTGIDTGITAEKLLKFLVRFGPETIVSPKLYSKAPHLFPKQFSIDGNILYIGNGVYDLTRLNQQDSQDIINYIEKTMHWRINRDNIFGNIKDTFPEVESYFNSNPDAVELEIFDGFKFTRDQFGMSSEHTQPMSTLGWYVSNNLLLSDLNDQLFKDPFVYADGIETVEPTSIEIKDKPINESAVIEKPKTGTNNNPFFKGLEDFGVPKKYEGPYSETLTNEEVTWLKNKLGVSSDSIKVVHDIIDLTKSLGIQAMGLMRADGITLFRGAEKGTAYHEAFHRVSLLTLSPSERNKMYSEYRKRNNFKGTDIELEENLADDFMAWKLHKSPMSNFRITKFFKSLYNFIVRWNKFTDTNLSNIFSRIEAGYYVKSQLNKQSLDDFLKRYPEGAPFTFKGHKFKHITNSQFDEAVNSMVATLFQVNNISTSDNLKDLNFQELYDSLAPEKVDTYENLSNQQRLALKEIYETFENIFLPEIRQKLSNYQIRTIDKEENIDAEIDAILTGDEVGSALQQHILSPIEVSKKENALGSTKIFMATIPDANYVDNKLSLVVSPVTGMPRFGDFGKTWNTILNNLHDCKTWSKLMTKVGSYAKQYPFFGSLQWKLNKVNNEALQTQIINTIDSAYHNMVDVIVGEGIRNGKRFISSYINDANFNRATKVYPDLWNSRFLNDSDLITYSGDKAIPNSTGIKEIISSFNKLVQSFQTYVKNPDKKINKIRGFDYLTEHLPNAKEALLNALDRAGVSIDMDTLNDVITKYYFSNDPVIAFNNMLQDAKGISQLFNYILENISNIDTNPKSENYGLFKLNEKVGDINKLYSRLNIIKNIAQAYAMRNPSPEELAVVSVDGKLLYPISAHNYMSDMIQYLNTDSAYAEQMAKVLYNTGANGKGSKLLSHILKGGKIKLNTIVSFKKENSSDTGRKYLEISKLEDYLMKMTFTKSDYMVMPTMGDSGTYNTISGMKLFHDHLLLDNQNKVKFNSQILEQFTNYYLAELDTIMFNYDNESKINEYNAIKNYHTGKRNGYRFRYFDLGLLNGQDKSFNAALEAAEKLDEEQGNKEHEYAKKVIATIKNDFTNLKTEDQYKLINKYLRRNLVKELEYAKELGLIKYETLTPDSNGKLNISNELIPTEWIDKGKSVYQNSNNQHAKLNSEAYAVIDAIAENMINTMISIEEIEKVFIKDPAYYKDTVDKIKRLREVLSTGTTPRTEFDPGNELNDFTQVNVGMLSDNEIPSRQLFEIKKKARESIAVQLLKEQGKTEEEAVEIVSSGKLDTDEYQSVWDMANDAANRDFNGYGEVNQTDATVLISPEMYKQLVRRVDGWKPDIAEAFDLLNDPEAKWETDPTTYSKALGITMKPLKMMYFGDHYNEELKLNVPIFDKMAMFPVHRIFSKGDLGALLERMEDPNNPLHMVAFESAVKVGQGSKTPYFLDKENTIINKDGLKNMITHKQDFKFFRRQLITDPHHASDQMFVSQAQKALMGNIREDRTYTTVHGEKLSGADVKRNIYSAIDALTRIGKKSFSNSFDINGSNGELFVSPIKISEVLTEDAKSSNMNQNVIEGLEINDNGELSVPLSAMSDSSWIESRIISLANKRIIDVSTPGGMFIQMSSFAYNSISVVPAKGRKKSLNFVNDDGSMDAVISINLLKHIIPEYENMSFSDAIDWLRDNGIIGDNAKPIAIGYRIPAQGQSSTAALKIVDVYPEQIGDTITLPDEFTKLTGSDFDIDKLFVARYNIDKKGKIIEFDNRDAETIKNEKWAKKEEEIRSSGIADEEFIVKEKYKFFESMEGLNEYDLNSQAANQNRLLSMYMSVITNPYHFSETRLPLDTTTDTLKNEYLKDIDERTGEGKIKPSTPLYYLTPEFQSRTKNELSGGKAGIAPFALNSAHHSLAQSINLRLSKSQILEKYGITDFSGIFGRDGVRILDWISAMVNAHVDVAKDPWIMRLNVVQWTYNMTNFLLRSGVGKSTFYFLPQRILKDMASKIAAFNGKFGVNDTLSRSKLEQEAISEVLKEYAKKGKLLTKDTAKKKLFDSFSKLNSMKKKDRDIFLYNLKNANSFDLPHLQKQLTKEETADWYLNQLMIYGTFMELTPKATSMSNLVNLSQIDTKKFGNNFGLQESFLYRWKDFLLSDKTFENAYDIFSKTFLLQKIKDGLIFPRNAFSKSFLRTSFEFSKLRSSLFALTDGLGDKNDNYINSVTRGIEASYKSSFFNKYIKDNNIDLNSLFFGDNSVAKRLYNIKKDAQSGKYPELLGSDGTLSNLLLEQLSQKPKLTTTDLALPDFIKYGATKNADGNIDNMLIRSWDELLDSDYPEVRKLAEDLVVYAFYTSGDSFGANTIFKYVPNEYKRKLGYFDYIRNLENNPSLLTEYFSYDNFFRNNWNSEDIVPTVELTRTTFDQYGERVENLPGIYTSPGSGNVVIIDGVEKTYPLIFTNTFARLGDAVGYNEENQPLYYPYVKVKLDPINPIGTLLYKNVGLINNKPVYVLTNKKGVSYQGSMLVEYSDEFNSIIPINNPLKNGELTVEKLYSVFSDNPYFDTYDKDGAIQAIGEDDYKGFVYITNRRPLNLALMTTPTDISDIETYFSDKPLEEREKTIDSVIERNKMFNAELVDSTNSKTVPTAQQNLFEGLKQVRINVPGTKVSIERAKQLINELVKAENKGGDIDSSIDLEMFTDWAETESVANLFNDKNFANDVSQILNSYIEKNPERYGTDFSELVEADKRGLRLSLILENIVKDSGAFTKEDKNQLNLFDDTNEFPTDEMGHCKK